MNIINKFNEHIFRGNDIRGVYPIDINEDVAYTIGIAFGSYIHQFNNKKCIVGHDNRMSSPSLVKSLIEGILSTGTDVYYLDLCSTPMYYYALIKNNIASGIMVTASHNPAEDNGFKMIFKDNENVCGEEIQKFKDFILNQQFINGNGKIFSLSIENDYINLLTKNIYLGNRKLNVVFDPANASTTVILDKVLQNVNINYEIINGESDSRFPNHHPNPQEKENMEQLKSIVLNKHYDLGVGIDGDGDRVGIIDELGNIIPADYLLIIFARYLQNIDKRILYDVKCSKSLELELQKLNLEPILYKNGSSYIKNKIKKDNIPFGGEYSGHIVFNDHFPCFDDGIYVALRLIEILSNLNMPLSELLNGITKFYNTDEIRIEVGDSNKYNEVEKVKKYCIEHEYEVNLIDGIKFDAGYAWGLVRASNTGPNLTLRFESETQQNLNKIQEEIINLIGK